MAQFIADSTLKSPGTRRAEALDMNARRLGALFAHLVATAAAPIAVMGCGGAVEGSPSPDSGPACEPTVTQPAQAGFCPSATLSFPCGIQLGDGGAVKLDETTCKTACPADVNAECYVYENIAAGETTTVSCGGPCGTGRRPAGLRRARSRATCADPVGEWFATMARLEAASVPAFVRLAQDLARLGAPHDSIARTRAAAKDEVRHARVTRVLARRRGAVTAKAVVGEAPRPSLARVALENAVEGCVRETYGALLATWQAAHAGDARIRKAMTRIAEDETRHAALSWDIHAWALGKLSLSARARVEGARREAARELLREIAAEPAPAVVREAGAPPAHVATALARSLERALLAA